MFSKKNGIRYGLVTGIIIICMVAWLTLPSPKLVEQKDTGTWHVIWQGTLAEATEANPGAGVSGFLEIFFLNHTATPTTAYDTNTSSLFESWCNTSLDPDGSAGTVKHAYAIADNFNLEVKHSTLMDIVVRCRWNRTVAWNGTMFRGSDCRINLTGSGGGMTISGTTSGTNDISYNTTGGTYIWINVYWDNGGAGYTLSKGGTFTISQISIQAKY